MESEPGAGAGSGAGAGHKQRSRIRSRLYRLHNTDYYKNKNTKQNTNKLVTTNYDIDLSVVIQFLWQ